MTEDERAAIDPDNVFDALHDYSEDAQNTSYRGGAGLQNAVADRVSIRRVSLGVVGTLTLPTFWQHWAPPPVLQSLEDVAVGVAVTVTVVVGSPHCPFGTAAMVRARADATRMRVSENMLEAMCE